MSYRSQPCTKERKLRRSPFYRPRLEGLEDRLPPGDTLGTLLAWSWWGPWVPLVGLGRAAEQGVDLETVPAAHRPATAHSRLVAETTHPGRPALLSFLDRMESFGNPGPSRTSPAIESQATPPAAPAWANLQASPSEAFLFHTSPLPPALSFGEAVPSSLGGGPGLAPIRTQQAAADAFPATQPATEAVRPTRPLVAAASLSPDANAPAGRALDGPSAAQRAQVRDSYGRLRLAFEANEGQTDPHVHFFARGSGYTLFLTSTEAVLSLQKTTAPATAASRQIPTPAAAAAVLRMQVVGANPAAQVAGRDQLPGKVNYFLGNDPSHWHVDVPTFARIEYQDIYPGIDLAYYGNQGQIEYDFLVKPGADPDAISLGFTGADHMAVDVRGDLAISVGGEEVLHRAPVVYQEVAGVRLPVAGRYVLDDPQHVHFQVGAYDPAKPLVIDPFVYSTFLGGSLTESGNSIAVDPTGFGYITGWTASPDFPTTNPLQPTLAGFVNAFVAKLNPDGSELVYSTYLGGSTDVFGGPGFDRGHGIAVDFAQFAYVTGDTRSTDFPTVNALQPQIIGNTFDAFVAKLNPNGDALVFSTYLGGHDSSDFQEGVSIAVNAIAPNFIYVAGTTGAPDFPTLNAVQPLFGGGHSDAFVTVLNADGSAFVYSTYLGGRDDECLGTNEPVISIKVDATGFAYVAGSTQSTDFPTLNALQPTRGGVIDAFVAKFAPTGDLVYSTYLDGSGNVGSIAYGIQVDAIAPGFVYVTGGTSAPNFPTVNALQPTLRGSGNAFLSKLPPDGSALAYSTFLGGSNIDVAKDIDVDSTGFIYLTGYTASRDFPTMNPLQQMFGGGVRDAFVSKLNPAGNVLVYSTYLGGRFDDSGEGIAVNPISPGFAYIMGSTRSPDFPTANALQPVLRGGQNAFVSVIV